MQSQILKASNALKACLIATGERLHFSPADTLFLESGDNAGVFLVIRGSVCLSMENMPRVGRLLGSRALLGLPSSFTGRPYSLTATAVSETDIAQVAREDFLRLMGERPDLCREAMEMLAKEMSFIQSTLLERQRKNASVITSHPDVAIG